MSRYKSMIWSAEFIASDDFLLTHEWYRLRNIIQAIAKSNTGEWGCMLCHDKLDHPGQISTDHIIPRKVNPFRALDEENIQILCHSCNKAKGNKMCGEEGFDFRPDWFKYGIEKERGERLRKAKAINFQDEFEYNNGELDYNDLLYNKIWKFIDGKIIKESLKLGYIPDPELVRSVGDLAVHEISGRLAYINDKVLNDEL